MSFMNGVTLGQFVPAESFLHRLDPRCKIVLTIAAMAAIFICSSFPALLLWGLLLPAVIYFSNVPAGAVLRSARPVLILIIFTAVLHLFWTDGRVILKFAFIKITVEGCVLALGMSLRLLYLVLYAGILTITTSPSSLSDGLEALMKPFARFGLPAHEIAMMMTIALRFIPTLFEETDRIIKSQASRGADFDSGGLMKRARAYIPVLIPLFVMVFQRADTLASAMEARCYRGGRGRVRMYPLVWGRGENIAVSLFALVFAAVFAAERLF